MMKLDKVIQELGRMRADFEVTAFESGDFETEMMWDDRVELINDAIEYLFQYQDLKQ